MRTTLIILLTFLNLFQKDVLGLKADLKKDRFLLLQEHGGTNIKVEDLNAFNSYANIDLSKFSSKKKVVNNNVITKWRDSKTPLTILKVETIIAGDTIYKIGEVKRKYLGIRQPLTGDIKLNSHNYAYNTYIIIPN